MPDQQDPPPPNSWADERDRRIEALRDLAQPHERQPGDSHATRIPLATQNAPLTPTTRSKKKPLIVAVSTLVCIAIIGGLIAYSQLSPKRSSGNHPPAYVTFSPASDNVTCPRDVAWSPDGATVAVLGYRGNCANDFPGAYSYHPGSVNLYSATTGHLIAAFSPDTAITATLHLTPPTIATPLPGAAPSDRNTSQQAINYAHLLWSPDSKQLAVTFSVLIATAVVANGGFETKLLRGVLLSDLSGAQTHVLSRIQAHGEWYSGLWNLADGSYIPANRLSPDMPGNWSASAALIPPALGYQWADTGRLQALTLLSATNIPAPQPSAPVGLPDGGKDFTVWQPGVAQIITQDESQPPQPLTVPVETWRSSFSAWSADGKFLFAGDSGAEVQNWRLALMGQPTPDSATLGKVGLTSAPIVPTRDAGLAAALHRYHDLSINSNAQNTPINLAWSPDGKRLAAEALIPRAAGDPQHASDFAVSIYDCSSGKLLGRLTPKLGLGVSSDPGTFLRWSPDGTHLLLYTTGLSGAQIWGAKDLPHER